MRYTAMIAAGWCAWAGCAVAGTGENAPLAPLEAGARQGQAIGAALVCPGVTLTKKAEDLTRLYSGRDLELFNAQAAKVADLWSNIRNCGRAGGPDQCRIVNQMSCKEAVREIGPQGVRLPGLIETAN